MRRVLLLLVPFVVLVSACAGSEEGETATDATGTAESGFPATITTERGDVEVPDRPERVVVLSDALLETVVELGVTPVAASRPLVGERPWLEGKIDEADTDLFSIAVTDAIPVEQVAATRPDLIVAPDYFVDDAAFDRLSQVAPTLSFGDGAGDSESGSWESQTEQLGAALGVQDRAAEVVRETRAAIEDAREAHPDLAGTSLFLGNFLDENQFVYIADDSTSSSRLFAALGLDLATVEGVEPVQGRGVVSRERFSDLDSADVLVMGASDDRLAEALRADPLFARLAAVREERAMLLDLTWVSAYNVPSAASIPFLLDRLDPYLDRAAAA